MSDSEKELVNTTKSIDEVSVEEMAVRTVKPSKKIKSSKLDFFSSLKAEFKKIIWPNRHTLTKQAAAVLAFSVALGLVITGVDLVIRLGLELIVK